MHTSEFDDGFEEDEQRIQGAILTEPIRGLLRGPPITIPAEITVARAVEQLQRLHIGCLLVVGPDGGLTGIFTERDLLTRVVGQAKPVDIATARVGDYMTPRPETLGPDDRIAWALNKMHQGGFRHVPIVNPDGKPMGLLSIKDIVDFIVELFPVAVLNLPPDPTKEAQALDGG